MNLPFTIYTVLLLKTGTAQTRRLPVAFFTKNRARRYAVDKKNLFMEEFDSYEIESYVIGDANENPAYQIFGIISDAILTGDEEGEQ